MRDISLADDEEVVTKFRYLYNYGIKMFLAEMVTQEQLQEVVLLQQTDMEG